MRRLDRGFIDYGPNSAKRWRDAALCPVRPVSVRPLMKKLPSEQQINADLRKLTEELRQLRSELTSDIRQRTMSGGKLIGRAGQPAGQRKPKKR